MRAAKTLPDDPQARLGVTAPGHLGADQPGEPVQPEPAGAGQVAVVAGHDERGDPGRGLERLRGVQGCRPDFDTATTPSRGSRSGSIRRARSGNFYLATCGDRYLATCGDRYLATCGDRYLATCGDRYLATCGDRYLATCGDRYLATCGDRYLATCGDRYLATCGDFLMATDTPSTAALGNDSPPSSPSTVRLRQGP